MDIKRTIITATLTALIIAMGITTGITNVTVQATLSPISEQIGNETTTVTPTTNATTTTDATTTSTLGQQQSTIHITKHGTNSYIISGEMSSIGSFHTNYRIAGERNAILAAENLIISTVTSDYNSSATIGYVRADNNTTTMTTATATDATLPNPFVTLQQINERITNELRSAIGEAENRTSQGQHVEIKCEFGMSFEDMRCHYVPAGHHVPIPQHGHQGSEIDRQHR
jgi:hypothetical protein